MIELLNKEYSWEEVIDIEQHIYDAMANMPGEFTGTLRVVVTYEPEEE